MIKKIVFGIIVVILVGGCVGYFYFWDIEEKQG